MSKITRELYRELMVELSLMDPDFITQEEIDSVRGILSELEFQKDNNGCSREDLFEILGKETR